MEDKLKGLLKGDLQSDLIRLLIDNSPVAYIILDEHYRIHYINDSFLKLRKLDLESTLGKVCYDISNNGKHCRQCAVEQALQTGQKAFIARKDTLPDGSVRFIDDYAIPIGENGRDGNRYVLEIMVNRSEEMLARERRDADYDESLSILAQLLEAKDNYTAAHSDGVRDLALRLARAMKLPPKDIFDISIAASLHDIGKVRIPYAIINKPGKLSDEEFALVKKHPAISFEMISDLSGFENIKNIVRQHHERIDGRGYPDGLSGEHISLGAKITAVADTYDAITTTRSYREGLSHEYAIAEIARVAGTQLDAQVVKAFLSMDFKAEKTAALGKEKDLCTVERVLGPEGSSLGQVKPKDFKHVVDEDSLLREIFENTPCGYVLMDIAHNVLFASKYFLDYMGLRTEEVLGKKCYEAAGVIGGRPCPGCAIERAVQSGKVEYMRQEQDTNNGYKIFDLFGMPLLSSSGKVEYIIEVILDRTAEVQLDRQREKDLQKLVNMMSGLLQEQEESLEDEYLSSKIIILRERLSELLEAV